ncbi:MAG: hypothetical protein ISP49_18745 [Reyranella sp.]|nr:hypothetical protein [Reyranella sp.]
MGTTFFDVPVYRLPIDQYDRQQNAYIAKILDGRDNPAFRDHLWDKYGGTWLFNEIIGYIRLHFLGGQVRGEYFAVKAKRIVRTRHKQFEYRTHKLAPEIDIKVPVTDATVKAAVSKYLQACQCKLPRHYIDLSVFDELAPYIRWYELWLAANPAPANPAVSRRWPRRHRRSPAA